jgi:ABC-2 type transport system permease protein
VRVLLANIEDVWREAAARWTLLAYFFLSTIFIIIFASAINLDVVDGTLAGAKLFGKNVHVTDQISVEKMVLGFESGFSGFLGVFGTFLAIFATAHLVPRLQEKGTIDLYLSRPISRVWLLLSRYIAGLLLAACNVFYLVGSIWLIVIWKTGVVHPRFLLSGIVIMFLVATMLAFAFLVGVVTSSTAVSIMATFGIFFFGLALAGHTRLEAAVSQQWLANLISALYWIFPKTKDLVVAVVAFVSGDRAPGVISQALAPAPFLTTAAFAIACLAMAMWRFQRKEF